MSLNSVQESPPEGPVVLDGVPAYNWYHGCGPTAVASVLGYWDLRGYPKFLDAEGWDQVRFTWEVRDHIASPAHEAKYGPTPDNPNLPHPAPDSLAGFLGTSLDPLGYGWTWLSQMEPGIEGYASFRGHEVDAWSAWVGTIGWEDIVHEIDAGRPMVFLVDTEGDGITDHFVPILGYDDRGEEGLWYGAYTTWSEEEAVEWFAFAPMAVGRSWGVAFVTFIHPLDSVALVAEAGGEVAVQVASAWSEGDPGSAWLL